MRQVPKNQIFESALPICSKQNSLSVFFANFLPAALRPVYVIIFLLEILNNFFSPVLTLWFFSGQSSVFLSSTPIELRGLYFGLCLGAARIGGVIATFIMSLYADRLGQGKMFYLSAIALLINVVAAYWALSTHHVWILIAGVFVSSCLYGGRILGMSAVRALLPKTTPFKYLGLAQGFIAMGACLGPILGGDLGQYSYHLPKYDALFLTALLISLLAIAFVHLKIISLDWPSIVKPASQKLSGLFVELWHNFLALWTQPITRSSLLLLILTQMLWAGYYEFMPVILKLSFNYNGVQLGEFISSIAIGLILTTLCILPWLQSWLSIKNIRWLALVVILLGQIGNVLFLLFAPNAIEFHTFGLYALAFPIAAGDVLMFCAIMSLCVSQFSKRQQASVCGLVYLISYAVWMLTAFGSGYLLRFIY